MVEYLDLEGFPFSLQDGQRLVLDVNWGTDGQARAAAKQQVFDAQGNLIAEVEPVDFAYGTGGIDADPSVLWIASDADATLDVAFHWVADDQGFLLLDGQELAALARHGAELGAGPAALDLLDGGGIVFGDDISMGDVFIGSDAADTYRVTGDSQGETVTIMGFGGASVLDISELLAGGNETLAVTYDQASGNSILTVSAPETVDTVIVVHGVDLTADFDLSVVTSSVI